MEPCAGLGYLEGTITLVKLRENPIKAKETHQTIQNILDDQ
jgi:hypothetical protein